MRIRSSLPILRVKRILNIETTQLSPIEKYKEVQKQDWQIEALIIGSVVFGLTQIPEVLENNYLFLASFFGYDNVPYIQAIFNIPFIWLLINLIHVLLLRLFWVIKAFNHGDFHRMNELSNLAGNYLSDGLLFFLILSSGTIFYLFLGYLLPEQLFFFCYTFLTSSLCIFIVKSFISLRKYSINTSEKGLGKLFYHISTIILFGISPAIMFFVRRHLNIYIIQNTIIRKNSSNQFKAWFDLSLLLLLLTYSFGILSSVHFIPQRNSLYERVMNHHSPIIIESDCMKDSTLWLFVHSCVIDGGVENKNVTYFGASDNEVARKSSYYSLNLTSVQLYINKRKIENQWYVYAHETGLGLKTFLHTKHLKNGINKLRLITNREEEKRYWDIHLFKP